MNRQRLHVMPTVAAPAITMAPAMIMAMALVIILALWTVPATAAPTVASQRLGGEQRYDTAAQIATAAFPNGAATVFVASGLNFPDALAASGLAGVSDGPVLLTDPDVLPADTKAALAALNPADVVVLGGTAAVSASVFSAIAADHDVRRVAGANRYATADALARAMGSDTGVIAGRKTAFIVTGQDFPDALAVGPLAFSLKIPILLTRAAAVPDVTLNALDDLGIEQVIIAGGAAVVSAAAEQQLEERTGNAAIRIGGANRTETAALLADFATRFTSFAGEEIVLASGAEFADAVAAGPYAGARGAPILLTAPTTVPDSVTSYLLLNDATIERVTAVGGTAALPQAVLNEAVANATSDPDAEVFTVDLSWVNEVGPEGDLLAGQPEGVGAAVLKLSPNKATIAYLLDAATVNPPFDGGPGAHIHRGAVDQNGPVIALLATGAELRRGQGGVAGYVRADAFTDTSVSISDLLTSPESFYINVHSDAYPAGAIRGQLPEGGQTEVAALVSPLNLTLDAQHELTIDEDTGAVNYGASTETGTAAVSLTFDLAAGRVSYTLDVSGVQGDLSAGAGAHIHEGFIDQNGPIVTTLATAEQLAAAPNGIVSGSFNANDFAEDYASLSVRGMFIASSDFYVNVHTGENPAGAVRAQLPNGGALP